MRYASLTNLKHLDNIPGNYIRDFELQTIIQSKNPANKQLPSLSTKIKKTTFFVHAVTTSSPQQVQQHQK